MGLIQLLTGQTLAERVANQNSNNNYLKGLSDTNTAAISLINNKMTASRTVNYTTASTSLEKIVLASYCSIGSKLTISDGGIKIGSGVSKVKVCYR